MEKKFGYKPSNGNFHNIDVVPFSQSPMAQNPATNLYSYTIPEHLPVFDQLSLSSCTANATAMAYAILQYLNDPGSVQYLSRLHLYYDARAFVSETNKDEGAYIHLLMDSLKKLGACLENIWDYNITNVYTEPPILAYKQASDNVISNFFQISTTGPDRINDIVTAINQNHPVIFGTEVSQDFVGYNGYSNNSFHTPSSSIGGHCMVIIGHRTNSNGEREFCIKNSWSQNWGTFSPIFNQRGYAWIASDYITWEQTNDLFVITKEVNLLV